MLCFKILFSHVWQNITPGMKLWGVVAEVNEKDLVVSLPGGLRGLVHASDAVDPIFDDEIEVCNKLFVKFCLFLLFFSHIFTRHHKFSNYILILLFFLACIRLGKFSFLVFFMLGNWFLVLY